MSKKQFLGIFQSECKKARINHIIEQDIFVSSMVRILLYTLNSDGHYIPSYDTFDENAFVNQFCDNLEQLKVSDFKSKLMSDKSKQLMKKSDDYLISGLHDIALGVAVASAATVAPPLALALTCLDFYISKKIKPEDFGASMYAGHTISSLSNLFVKKTGQKKLEYIEKLSQEDRKKLGVPTKSSIKKFEKNINSIVSYGEDYFALAPDAINSETIGYGTTGITATSDIASSFFYGAKARMNIYQENKAESEWLSNYFVNTLVGKFKRKASDKKTLYSMLLFANEYALKFSINV